MTYYKKYDYINKYLTTNINTVPALKKVVIQFSALGRINMPVILSKEEDFLVVFYCILLGMLDVNPSLKFSKGEKDFVYLTVNYTNLKNIKRFIQANGLDKIIFNKISRNGKKVICTITPNENFFINLPAGMFDIIYDLEAYMEMHYVFNRRLNVKEFNILV